MHSPGDNNNDSFLVTEKNMGFSKDVQMLAVVLSAFISVSFALSASE